MAFRKGISGNPKGRPAGAKDKKSEQLREWLMGIFKKHRDTLAEDLAAVDPATRWNIIAKLLPYILPRLNAVEIEGATDDGNKEPLFIVARPSGYKPASTEDEVAQRVNEELKQRALKEGRPVFEVPDQETLDALKAIDEEEDARQTGRPVIRCADELEMNAIKAIAKQNNARRDIIPQY